MRKRLRRLHAGAKAGMIGSRSLRNFNAMRMPCSSRQAKLLAPPCRSAGVQPLRKRLHPRRRLQGRRTFPVHRRQRLAAAPDLRDDPHHQRPRRGRKTLDLQRERPRQVPAQRRAAQEHHRRQKTPPARPGDGFRRGPLRGRRPARRRAPRPDAPALLRHRPANQRGGQGPPEPAEHPDGQDRQGRAPGHAQVASRPRSTALENKSDHDKTLVIEHPGARRLETRRNARAGRDDRQALPLSSKPRRREDRQIHGARGKRPEPEPRAVADSGWEDVQFYSQAGEIPGRRCAKRWPRPVKLKQDGGRHPAPDQRTRRAGRRARSATTRTASARTSRRWTRAVPTPRVCSRSSTIRRANSKSCDRDG